LKNGVYTWHEDDRPDWFTDDMLDFIMHQSDEIYADDEE
jgi:hypothetical protein